MGGAQASLCSFWERQKLSVDFPPDSLFFTSRQTVLGEPGFGYRPGHIAGWLPHTKMLAPVQTLTNPRALRLNHILNPKPLVNTLASPLSGMDAQGPGGSGQPCRSGAAAPSSSCLGCLVQSRARLGRGGAAVEAFGFWRQCLCGYKYMRCFVSH